jgi:hypothetical protein
MKGLYPFFGNLVTKSKRSLTAHWKDSPFLGATCHVGAALMMSMVVALGDSPNEGGLGQERQSSQDALPIFDVAQIENHSIFPRLCFNTRSIQS